MTKNLNLHQQKKLIAVRTILKNIEQIVTVDTKGENFKRGKKMNDLQILSEYALIIEDEIIKDIVPNSKSAKIKADKEINLKGKIVLPGIIDCHTHTVFSGSRADEFVQKLQGVSYEEIAKKGGGIQKTVNSVRHSSFDELYSLSEKRVRNFIEQGVTSLEIKSGYGLSFYDEIKMLQVINRLNSLEISIIPTFLGAHTFPKEYQNDKKKYIQILTDEMLPYIAKNKLAIFCDAFCETTAFSTKEVEIIFEKANDYGFLTKLHTDQFNSIGGIDIAIKSDSKSVDHLEVISDDDIMKLANTDITAVLLPGVSFTLNYNFAPARKLIDSNSIVAIATDFNPGSSPIQNISLIMSIAAMKMEMTPEEIISAFTINAANALGISNKTGSIEINKLADFSVYDCNDYNEIIYNIGRNINSMTISKGKIIYQNLMK